MATRYPLPSWQSLKDGDIYLGGPELGVSVVKSTGIGSVTIQSATGEKVFTYAAASLNEGIFVRVDKTDRKLAIIAEGGNFRKTASGRGAFI